jgi:IclR family mhp operon transcriptional activator
MGGYSRVRALTRGIEILQLLNQHATATPQELANASGLARPTTYRLLETLRSMGIVERARSHEGYRLTSKVRTLSSGFQDDSWVIEVATPVLMKLGQEVLWPAALLTFEQDAMVVRESTHPFSPVSINRGMEGRRIPIMLTAGGRAYLAFCPDGERRGILERLARSDSAEAAPARDARLVGKIIERTRTAGYGERMNGEFTPDSASIALPIRYDGRVVGCIPIIWFRWAVSPSKAVEQVLPPLRTAVSAIEHRLQAHPDVLACASKARNAV